MAAADSMVCKECFLKMLSDNVPGCSGAVMWWICTNIHWEYFPTCGFQHLSMSSESDFLLESSPGENTINVEMTLKDLGSYINGW